MSLISLLKQHEDENLEYAVGDIITERHKFHIEMTDEKNYVEIKMKTDNQKAKEIATKWRAQGLPYNAIHEAVKEMVSFQWQAYVHLIWKLSSANYEKGKEEMKQQMIVKAYEWIKLLSDTHYIMHYSDCCEVTLGELKDWFKSYMED